MKQPGKKSPLNAKGKRVDRQRPALQQRNQGMLRLFAGIGVLAIVFFIFRPFLQNGLINWDDPEYILQNKTIMNFSPDSIRHIFSSYFMGNYHPLTMLSYAFEYSLFKMEPKGYHVVSLSLHLLNTLLVFLLIYKLLGKKLLPAAFISLLFGIHPMHVESVVWASERKDLLYTTFFLLSLIFYTGWLHQKKPVFLILCFLSYLLSLFSKGQAVVLPLILFMIDYLERRPFKWKMALEKIPFLLLSLLFGIIAVFAQRSLSAINEVHLSHLHRFFFGFYALVLYLLKSIFPYPLSGFHDYPFTADLGLPVWVILSPLIVICLIFILFKFFRNDRMIIFGSGVFIISILPLLQFLPIGKAVISERYTYLSYLGLFLIFWRVVERINASRYKKNLQLPLIMVTGVFLLFFAIQTYARTTVWKTSVIFWSDVTSTYPDALLAHEHLGLACFFDNHDIPEAIREMDKAISINPSYLTGYRLKGFFYLQTENYEEALRVLTKALTIDTSDNEIYLFRGKTYRALQQYDKAIADFSSGIRKKSDRSELYMQRGIVYTDNLAQYDLGIKDFKKALSLTKDDPDVSWNLAIANYKKGDFKEAGVNFSRVIKIPGYKNLANAYYLRAYCYSRTNEFSKALDDAQQAALLGYKVPAEFMKMLENRK
ncbi:MAG: tetratricopeptide repeat protein [Bacteroidetes bacterium]|nr:tetratricopeptide repeat protein [Bacteroidota bacterium]